MLSFRAVFIAEFCFSRLARYKWPKPKKMFKFTHFLYLSAKFGFDLNQSQRTKTISRKRTKNEKSKDYCKADQNNVYCSFITIFRLAIPV